MTKRGVIFAAVALLLAAPGASEARVVRFVVEQTRIFAGGTSFGDVGTYQRLDGTAFMEVYLFDPLNALIVNIDKAPRNARGMVEFSAPFFLLKPTDMARKPQDLLHDLAHESSVRPGGSRQRRPAGSWRSSQGDQVMRFHPRRSFGVLALGVLMAAAVPGTSEARLVRFVVEQREPFAGGAAWGTTGPYERLVGTAHLEVDPRDPLNAVIVDLDKAPRNARGHGRVQHDRSSS